MFSVLFASAWHLLFSADAVVVVVVAKHPLFDSGEQVCLRVTAKHSHTRTHARTYIHTRANNRKQHTHNKQ